MRLADGRSLPVRQPVFVAPGSRRIAVITEDDSRSVIEPLLIVSLGKTGSHSPRSPGLPDSTE